MTIVITSILEYPRCTQYNHTQPAPFPRAPLYTSLRVELNNVADIIAYTVKFDGAREPQTALARKKEECVNAKITTEQFKWNFATDNGRKCIYGPKSAKTARIRIIITM